MSRGAEKPEAPVAAAAMPPTQTKKDRIVALLRAKGLEPSFDAPAVTSIQTAGPQSGRLVGADVNPELEYVRVNANAAETIRRYLDRGYGLVSPEKDVRIDNCSGPDDVMMAAPRELVSAYRAARKERRAARRGAGQATDGRTNYKSSEGAWKHPAT